MARVQFTNALRNEYQTLFDTCQIKPAKVQEVEKIVSSLLANKARYADVSDPLGIPWYVVAVIHNMECSQNFNQHLHNGDPLTARTIQVPQGRPVSGNPPFTWEESATDALTFDGLPKWKDWSIPGILYCLERYNGWGYRAYHPAVKSPYLWSGSNQYISGKYVADGTWSDSAVSGQCGVATLLRRIAEKGELDADSHITDSTLASDISKSDISKKDALFTYSPDKIITRGIELQKFLNRFPGIFLKEDGKLGEKTSDACMRIFGFYLTGDPRA